MIIVRLKFLLTHSKGNANGCFILRCSSKTRRFAVALLSETTSCVKDYIYISFVAGSNAEGIAFR